MRRFYISLGLACLLAGTLWASDDPFCGKWKLNAAKSKLAGEQVQIQSAGGNKYKWTFSGVSETYTYDGTDQPSEFGSTVSIAPAGQNRWKMVIKRNGKVISSMTHTIAADGKSQTIKGTDFKPDGTTSDYTVVWKKLGSGTGWNGTWEETGEKATSPDEFEVEAYEGDGLSINTPAYKDVLRMKFDGKDYEEQGPYVAAGSASSGKRVNAHTLEIADKVKGKEMDRTHWELSSDGKTLTITVRGTGQPKAQTMVYDKM